MFERCVLTFTTNRNYATSRALRVCIAIVGVSAASSLIAAAQLAVQHAFAEDSTRVALADLDATFLLRNLAIIAARFNVDATAAAIEQARLWPNPNISTEQIVNAGGRPPFDFTRTGNTDISLSQLIVLAGKRSKQVQLATISRDVAQYQVADLLRALRFELRSDFFSLYYLQRAVGFDDRIIASLAGTITAAERMYESRSLLLSELVRLRALLLTVQAERLYSRGLFRNAPGRAAVRRHVDSWARWSAGRLHLAHDSVPEFFARPGTIARNVRYASRQCGCHPGLARATADLRWPCLRSVSQRLPSPGWSRVRIS